MKVIHYIASIDQRGGGTTEYMRLLTNSLMSEVELVVATGLSENPIELNGVRVQFFNSSVLRWYSLLREFRVFLKEENPAIVHINGIWTPENWGFQKVAQELGIKVLVSPHGMLEPWILAQSPLKKKLGLFMYQSRALQTASHLHVTALMEARNIEKLGFNNKMTVIPNGIDQNDILQVKENYSTNKMIFLSRIHPKKGIELLLEAWKNCDCKGWTLEIAGNGDATYIESILELVQKFDNVTFVGAKYGEDKWDFIRSASVMVLPTYSENFGIVVAEALAVGVPVITTTGTPWEDLKVYNCGWWIDLSVSNLEKTIKEVFNTHISVLKKMGSQGKTLVNDKYEMKKITMNLKALYDKILLED
ncbi:MAG: hypothetical protein QG594_712 [Bacteroidota bacterium]|nr:hypothetical protein [Bacteroidota bacterium]